MSAYLRVWPGLAVGICVVGLIARGVFGIGVNPSASPTSEQTTGLGRVRGQAAIWLIVLGAHLIAAFAPRTILAWNSQAARLYLLEAGGLVVGLLALFVSLRAISRHVRRSSGGVWSALFDSAFLGTILAAVVSGLVIALRYRWASSWSVATIAPYVDSLMEGRPRPQLVTQMPVLIQLHVIAGFTAVALFPFTRASAVMMTTLARGADLGGRPVLTAGAKFGSWLRQHSPASMIWPDEDVANPLVVPTVWPKATMAGESSAEGSGSLVTSQKLRTAEGSAESTARISEGR